MEGFMRKVFSILSFVLVLTVPGVVAAGKIGFVNAEKAVVQVDEGQAKLTELEAWAKPAREQVQQAAARVAELHKRIESQSDVTTEESLKELRQQELTARRDYEDRKREFDRDLAKKQDEFLADVALKMGQVASEYGKQNGYDAIFVYEAQPLIYVADEADLTALVVRLYNERFPYDG
jgi:outer membrane protein